MVWCLAGRCCAHGMTRPPEVLAGSDFASTGVANVRAAESHRTATFPVKHETISEIIPCPYYCILLKNSWLWGSCLRFQRYV